MVLGPSRVEYQNSGVIISEGDPLVIGSFGPTSSSDYLSQPRQTLAMLSKIFFSPRKNRIFIFPLFFGKIGQNPPGSLKLDPASQDFQYEPNPSEFDRFRQTFSFFENLQKKCQKKWPKNESFFIFFPTPQPPSPSPQTPKDAPDHAGVVRQSFIPIGQNGTPVMPI